MSFDIFYQPCRFSGAAGVQTNPFTGAAQPAFPSEPLTAAELRAVRRVLERASARSPDESGCHLVTLADGGEAEVFASDLEQGCMVAVRGTTPGLIRFLFDLLVAGRWVMLPAIEECVALTTSPANQTGVPDDFPRMVVCHSADELAALLSGGVRAWQKYRDQVVNGEWTTGATVPAGPPLLRLDGIRLPPPPDRNGQGRLF